MRFFVALWVSKFIRLIIRIFGKMLKLNGSHFPGNIAIKICPNFLEIIKKPETIITVTGTNGKTTTCNLITDILQQNGYKVLNNKFGSNIRGGITTTLISGVSLFNKSKYKISVLEVDERSSHLIYPYIKPNYVVVTNLFRDSLKRNAHSEYIYNIIEKAIPDNSKLILNADDLISNRLKFPETRGQSSQSEGMSPVVSDSLVSSSNRRVFFGIDKLDTDENESINIVNDVRICPNCSAKLKYDFVRYHHIGKAYCENCGYKSPEADYSVKEINYEEGYILVASQEKEHKIKMLSNSIFNIYNQIAAIAVLREFGISFEKLQESFEKIEITKERYKKETFNGVNIINHLAKGQNPIACSIVFKYVKEEARNKELILLIEDFHDNKESSECPAWLYDCDFEFLNDESITKIIAMGHRGEDLKFRLLLAGVPEEKIVSLSNDGIVTDYLSLDKDKDIYVLYDMYEQPIVDEVNRQIKKKLSGGDAQ